MVLALSLRRVALLDDLLRQVARLTGYGGGLEAKRWLLELEGAWPVRTKPGQPRLF